MKLLNLLLLVVAVLFVIGESHGKPTKEDNGNKTDKGEQASRGDDGKHDDGKDMNGRQKHETSEEKRGADGDAPAETTEEPPELIPASGTEEKRALEREAAHMDELTKRDNEGGEVRRSIELALAKRGRRGGSTSSGGSFSYGVNLDMLAASHPAKTLRPGQASLDHACDKVTSVPSELRKAENMFPNGLHADYVKYTHAYGIPIVGTKTATDEGLKRACYVVRYLFASRYDARNAYYKVYGRIALIADDQQQTSLPEYKTWDSSYWDSRARGLGPTVGIPMTSVGDDNQRCAPKDRYWDQDILIHEFSHGDHLMASSFAIEGFARSVGDTYRAATQAGKWNSVYAGRNPNEYFATGAQFFFNAISGFSVKPKLDGAVISDRASLQKYDPGLYSLLQTAFPCFSSSTDFIERCAYKKAGGTAGQPDLAAEKAQKIPALCTTGPTGTARCKVPSADQKQCGPPGISSAECASIGCCYTDKCVYPIQDCNDKDVYCHDWAMNGECSRNPGLMYVKCPFACGRCEKVKSADTATFTAMCQDKTGGNCAGWANSGECTRNPAYMNRNCALSCGACTAPKDPFP
jgi:hypothetical protein